MRVHELTRQRGGKDPVKRRLDGSGGRINDKMERLDVDREVHEVLLERLEKGRDVGSSFPIIDGRRVVRYRGDDDPVRASSDERRSKVDVRLVPGVVVDLRKGRVSEQDELKRLVELGSLASLEGEDLEVWEQGDARRDRQRGLVPLVGQASVATCNSELPEQSQYRLQLTRAR